VAVNILHRPMQRGVTLG